MGFIEVMREREMLAQVTHEEELTKYLAEGRRTAYIGFDPTAGSLHVGHLMTIMAMRRWQAAGHRIIALLGGGTAMVGDPTGKTDMRQMESVDIIDQRARAFAEQLGRLVDFSSPERGIVVNNGDWLRDLRYLPFLRDIGAHFSVNRMLTAECFKQRLEKGLSFLEFNYMLLQSYDFYHLNKEYDCAMQIGGDDQWSNMLGGMELVRRKEGRQAYCMTVPLLVTSSGKKMGKTEAGAVWLSAELTPPYDLFQYFRNVDDDMVEKCLFYFTDLPVAEVRRLGALRDREINDAKVVLGYELVKLLHGEDEAEKAKAAAAKLFGGDAGQSVDAPEALVSAADVGETINVIDLMVLAKIVPTKSEGRRLIQQGGLVIDDEKVEDINYGVPRSRIAKPEGMLVRKGKKHYFRLRFSE